VASTIDICFIIISARTVILECKTKRIATEVCW